MIHSLPRNFDVVIYHAQCADGFGAAYAAWKYLGSKATYIACNHGDDPPDVKDKDVIILDFSFPRSTLEEMNENANTLLVLDHHVSARDRLDDLSYTHFDMDQSGAMLTWRYFFPNTVPPDFIAYIQDRDLWQWKLQHSREFSAGLETVPFRFAFYKELEKKEMLESLIQKGRCILEAENVQVERICANAMAKKFLGYDVLVVNSCNYESQVGSQLAPHCDFAVIWCYDHRQGDIRISLRSSADGANVSVIATQFGGGGHAQAAGFRIASSREILGFFDD